LASNLVGLSYELEKGKHVQLTVEQKEILRRIFDRNESPGEISAPLSAYLALFHVAGPRDLAAHVSALPLSADTFTTCATNS